MKYSASSVWENKDEYDVVVVGAGHAGCEAALATARLGFKTVIFTVSVDSIALMPCNPNIGGSSKGHLVRELDALGGEMGKVIDQTFIQSKMLNSSKGPAVHSLRAQADKANYSKTMRQVLQNQENLDIRQMEVTEILAEDGKITGVQTYSGAIYRCKAVVLCTGTYLKARCIYGEISTHTGPNGLQSANYLTDSLKALGIKMYRFKTGTPARIDKNTIDFSKMQEQKGDERVVPFSFTTDPESVQIDQASCWLTYTNETTHEIIRGNLDRSPLYSGAIEERHGIINLIEAFKKNDIDAELHFYGDGSAKDKVIEAALTIPQIKFFGQKTREEIIKKQKSAFLLVNPRTSDGEFTKYSFPSKVIEYFASGTPTLMYKLEGIPDKYYKYCFIPEDESVEELANSLHRILLLNEYEMEKKGKEAKKFIVQNKNCQFQTQKIINLIKKI